MKSFRASDLHGSGKNFRDLVHVLADMQEPQKYVRPDLRLVVAGSREGIPPQLVYKAIEVWISKYGKPHQILSGTQRGVDKVGEAWAKAHGIEVVPFPPNWKKYDKGAGPIRNEKMAIECSHGIVVHSGTSGSMNMAENLRKYKKPILEVVVKPDGTFDIRT